MAESGPDRAGTGWEAPGRFANVTKTESTASDKVGGEDIPCERERNGGRELAAQGRRRRALEPRVEAEFDRQGDGGSGVAGDNDGESSRGFPVIWTLNNRESVWTTGRVSEGGSAGEGTSEPATANGTAGWLAKTEE